MDEKAMLKMFAQLEANNRHGSIGRHMSTESLNRERNVIVRKKAVPISSDADENTDEKRLNYSYGL